MIGKIVTGKSFKGAVEYAMNKPGARLLACDGVDGSDARSVTRSFNFQRKARPEKEYIVGHISLSFHPDDTPKLTDETMVTLAEEYMQRMGITDTQYIVVRHTDTEHSHLHIVYNRVKYDAKLVRSHNERIRNVAVCKAVKQKYGLTFSGGKENVKTERLHGADKVKYVVYETIEEALPRCLSLTALADELKRQGIAMTFVYRGGDSEKEVQGLTFTKDAITFKASQVDRKFSYGNLCKRIEANRMEAEAAVRQTEKQKRREQADERRREAARLRREERARQKEVAFQQMWREFIGEEIGRDPDAGTSRRIERETVAVARQDGRTRRAEETVRRAGEERAEGNVVNKCSSRSPAALQRKSNGMRPTMPSNGAATERSRERIDEIRGRRLSPQEQAQLYSPQGLRHTYRKGNIEYTRLYRPIISERGPDILTEHTVSERRIDTNPVVYGIRLSDEQLRKIGEGEYIRLENMKHEDGTLFSGYVVMDDRFRASWIFRQPPDRIVKEDKFYIREMDKLLADHGYVVRAKVRFWSPTQPESRQYFWKDKYGLYDCSYDDPRLPKPPRQEIRVPSVPPLKKSRGPKL